jgi:hypothetical protein
VNKSMRMAVVMFTLHCFRKIFTGIGDESID